jgi:RNA polymerase sigma-70 factor (ECF subfamily)
MRRQARLIALTSISDQPDPKQRGPRVSHATCDWPAVLHEHQRWLRLVVRSRLRETDAVDEVMQNIALVVVGQRTPLRDPARLSAWLYRVAVRQALLFRRGMGRSRRLLARAAGDLSRNGESSGLEADPLDWLIRRERSQMIRSAVDRLPPRDAEILLLKYVENWTTRDLSNRLGVSQSAIEARLHRVRQRLRADLVRSQVVESRE